MLEITLEAEVILKIEAIQILLIQEIILQEIILEVKVTLLIQEVVNFKKIFFNNKNIFLICLSLCYN
jgi:hypothetical protein